MKIQLEMTLSNGEVDTLRAIGLRHGYHRENPCRPWSIAEQKESARIGLMYIIRSQLECRGADART